MARRSTGRERKLRSCSHGFTYIGLLIAILVLGIGLAVVGTVSHTLQLRDKERELLFVGDQFRRIGHARAVGHRDRH